MSVPFFVTRTAHGPQLTRPLRQHRTCFSSALCPGLPRPPRTLPGAGGGIARSRQRRVLAEGSLRAGARHSRPGPEPIGLAPVPGGARAAAARERSRGPGRVWSPPHRGAAAPGRVYLPGRRGGVPGRSVCAGRPSFGLCGRRARARRTEGAGPAATMSGEWGASGAAPPPSRARWGRRGSGARAELARGVPPLRSRWSGVALSPRAEAPCPPACPRRGRGRAEARGTSACVPRRARQSAAVPAPPHPAPRLGSRRPGVAIHLALSPCRPPLAVALSHGAGGGPRSRSRAECQRMSRRKL